MPLRQLVVGLSAMERTVQGGSDSETLYVVVPVVALPDARFPTVVVGWRGVFGGVHLGSWAANRQRRDNIGSGLNGSKRS